MPDRCPIHLLPGFIAGPRREGCTCPRLRGTKEEEPFFPVPEAELRAAADPFGDLRREVAALVIGVCTPIVQRLANLLCCCGWHSWEQGACLNCHRRRNQ